jgi:hypothetical protein
MTISESLISLNSFPIPTSFISKVGIDRDLIVSEEYTYIISNFKNYQLAIADVYMWLYGQPSITEQEVGVNQLGAIKKGFFDIANAIYKKYNDAKYSGSGIIYGFIGDAFNV